MYVIENLTPGQSKIIKEICIHQLRSLERLYNDESKSDIDITMFLLKREVSPEEFKEQLLKNMEKFQKVEKEPDSFASLDTNDLSMFRHILAKIEDNYTDKYPNAISNLWRRLFLIEDLKLKTLELN